MKYTGRQATLLVPSNASVPAEGAEASAAASAVGPEQPSYVDPADEPYWLALYSVAGVGPVRFYRLVQQFGSARSAWGASRSDLLQVPGIGPRLANAIEAAARRRDVESVRHRLAAQGIRWVLLPQPGYPRPLRFISSPPPVLYFRSASAADTLSELLYGGGPAVAVVGTRRPTGYGQLVARSLARGLSEAGLTVVSGLALGIDTAAHLGALEAAQGSTVAVLASGVDRVYPRENVGLAERLVERGALVSEVSPGKPLCEGGFPARNRIVSGLCSGVLVVEAPPKSGALITARHACDQGREVFAVPGCVTCDRAWGPNSLIRDGACLVRDVADILDELLGVGWGARPQRRDGPRAAPAAGRPGGRRSAGPDVQGRTADGRVSDLLDLLQGGGMHADDLSALLGLGPADVGALLSRAEVAGLVVRTEGGLYELAQA